MRMGSTKAGFTASACVGRFAASFALLLIGLGALVGTGTPRVDAQADDATLLAERYAPILMLKSQADDCDPEGEPYAPASVEVVLDNPEVLLRQVGEFDPVVRRGPTAADLFELSEGFYLDFPGSALEPGCIYEQDFDRYQRDRPATVYAHIVQSEDHPDILALQYWFYWYFNDWNNKHESDWEGIQLLFEASTVADALATEPTSIGYAQHEGGERADWDAEQLDREGMRPLVYSSAGSHASYFGSATYLGRGPSEGFGCDTTVGPSDRVEPEVVLLPDQVTDPDDPLAWLAFDGRWGERQSGPFNGPTGPTSKERWTDPVGWHDELRTSSVLVPGGGTNTAFVVDVFCGAVESGSQLLINFTLSPFRVLISLLALVLVVRWLVRRTTWTDTPIAQLYRRRLAGQILRAAGRRARRDWRVLLVFGVVYVPTGVLVGALALLLPAIPFLGDILGLSDNSGATNLALSVFVGGLPHLVAFVIANALVSTYMNGAATGAPIGWSEAVRAAHERLGDILGALLRASVVVGVLLVSVVGIPFAIRQLVRYQFVAQVVMVDGCDRRTALRRSSELVRGRWWRTAGIVATINVAVAGIAMSIGLLLLIAVAGMPFWMFSVLLTLNYVVLVPPAAVALTYLFGDAVVCSQSAADESGVADASDPTGADPDEALAPA